MVTSVQPQHQVAPGCSESPRERLGAGWGKQEKGTQLGCPADCESL